MRSRVAKPSFELQFKRLRYVSLLSVLLVAIGAVILGVFQYQSALDEHITRVEQKNILVAQSVRAVLWHHHKMLMSVDDPTAIVQQDPLGQHADAHTLYHREFQLRLPADPDKLLRPLLTQSRINKLKIYNVDGVTLYSTRPEEIGRSHSWSRGLQQALTGKPYSVVVSDKEMHESLPIHTEYVETYVPIFAFPESKVIGVFEIYSDVGDELAAIRMKEQKEAGALALLFLLLVAVLAIFNRFLHKRDLARAQQLIHLATHDPLTDLPNGVLLRDRLAVAISRAKPLGRTVAILLIDLDRFQLINNNLGHDTGDQVIKVIANRLSALAGQNNILGRFAGEFVMIFPELEATDTASTMINRMTQEIKRPVSVDDQKLILGCTVGVSLYPRDALDVESLLKRADIARNQAKVLGGNSCQFYSREMDAGLSKKMHMSSALQGALEREEFLLHYQPQFDLRNGHLIAAEALLRWQRDDQSLVPPNEFIPLAEDIGLIGPIGEWVLTTACKQVSAWHMAGFPKIRVAVNVSARQLELQDLAKLTETVLAESGLESHHLDLELTESLIMRNPDKAIATFNRIKEIGVGLSIDDFGTAYSSMNYLKRFPLDRLKIDRSFVRDLMTNPEDKVITLTIIAMAHHLRLKVIAEGVETKDHLRLLHKHGCDEVQGFYCGRPIPAEEFAHLLREGRRLRGYEKVERASDASSNHQPMRLVKYQG